MLNFLQFVIILLLSLTLNSVSSIPSIKPFQPFKPNEDAAILCKSIEDKKNINRTAIIEIVTARTSSQRYEIQKAFNLLCPKIDLLNTIKTADKNMHFYYVIHALLTPLTEFYARRLCQESAQNIRLQHVTLDILATASNQLIEDIKKEYNRLKLCSKSIEDALHNPYRSEDRTLDFNAAFFRETRSNYQQAMNTAEPFDATTSAKMFHKIGYEKNTLTRTADDERKIVKAFRQWSIAELVAALNRYEELYFQSVETAFKNRGLAADIENGVLTMIRVIRSAPLYFADRLYESLRGTRAFDDFAVIRIIVGRSEIDMVDIAKEFEYKYGKSLASVILSKKEDKDYGRALISIMGSEK